MRKVRAEQLVKLVDIEMKKIQRFKANSNSYLIVRMKLAEIKGNEIILSGC
jgi:hypothetical protein